VAAFFSICLASGFKSRYAPPPNVRLSSLYFRPFPSTTTIRAKTMDEEVTKKKKQQLLLA
jgi:hypothetical protein